MTKIVLDSSWRKTILSLGIGILSLAIFSFFPTDNFIENLTKSLVFLIIIPYLFVRIVLGESLSDFGMRFKLEKRGFLGSTLLVLLGMLIIYPLANYTSFPKYYALPPSITGSFTMFVFYELILVNLLLLFQEYFFKGFLISVSREKFSRFSIWIQAFVYLIPLAIISTSLWKIIPMAIISIIGGLLAYKTKTFFYSYIGSLIFLILLDAYLIFLSQKSL